ncbi:MULTISPECIES: M10 family metallopeptidase C-terminal domain-containing protein [unclassified Rhizobium]|uniref:calcium-binding protein n=1 Tax=unclassified Rhizobium TaxID=2613769 RepID=UPI0007130FB5|nr:MULTISPECIES: M10 family metallopeptidase C-terminal domain-containing protein [unclassified Rhizobium]KQS96382.1 hypothetical protein ASG50_04795 [Rhizobium sp. Leaf386]KQU09544.1 hypothetical protein ASG68_00580 [Rhizobium sp. Leaf453]
MARIVGKTSADETLRGTSGDDVIIGGVGYNTLFGGGGADVFVVGSGFGRYSYDTIEDFQRGIDKIDVSAIGFSSFSQMMDYASGYNLSLATGVSANSRGFELGNLKLFRLSPDDFIFNTSKTYVDRSTGESEDLFGTAADDVMVAQRGDWGGDTLYGGDGNDVMDGRGDMSARLYGGDGNDTMISIGNDVYGGNGNDTLTFYGGGIALLNGGQGADIFKVPPRVISEYSGPQAVIEDFKIGIDRIDVSGFGVTSFAQLKALFELPERGGRGTYFDAYYGATGWYSEGEYSVEIRGIRMEDLSASDFIFAASTTKPRAGTALDDVIFAGSGNDRINGSSGYDKLFGGAGNDVLIGGYGTNELYGEEGSDTFVINAARNGKQSSQHIGDFEAGVDKIDLSATGISDFEQLQFILEPMDGQLRFRMAIDEYEHSVLLRGVRAGDLKASDFIFYQGEGKVVSGSTFMDRMFGSRFADTLSGRVGNDELLGGGGNDRLLGGDGDDTLYGGAGNDILEGGAGNDRLYGGTGTDLFKLTHRGGSMTWLADFQAGVDKLDLSILGISSLDQVQMMLKQEGAAKSSFTIHFLDRLVTVVWENFDILKLTAGNFVFNQSGSKNLVGTYDRDDLFGSTKSDTLKGGMGSDRLFGGDGNDTLYGDDYDDQLYGGRGDDTIFGGDDNDAITPGLGKDRVDGGEGIDTIHFVSSVVLDLTSPANNTGEAKSDTYTNIEVFRGSASDDLMTGDALVNTFYGEAGNDIVKGMAGNDKLDGGNGDDRLYGGSGDDRLLGGRGNDRLYGEAGFDAIEGRDGDDTIVASSWDEVNGGEGVDRVVFSKPVVVSVGRPSLGEGEAEGTRYYSIEIFEGSSGDDIMAGSSYAETLRGGGGDDALGGMAGKDVLSGGDGADLVYGGLDADMLYGGKGADLFAYDVVSDSRVAEATRDTIFDFSGKEGDRIELSNVDANTKLAGNQDFIFLGTAAFTGKAGELRYDKAASDTYIYADINGDTKADFAIHLDDAMALSKGYFVL